MSKSTNSKHQITNKSQISIFNDQNFPGQDIVWIFEFWPPVLRSSLLRRMDWNLPFDLTQGGESFDFAQNREPVENPELVNNPEHGRRVEVVERPF